MYLHTWLFTSAWSTKLWLVPVKKNVHHSIKKVFSKACLKQALSRLHLLKALGVNKFSNNFWRDVQVCEILLWHTDSQGKENVMLVPYIKINLNVKHSISTHHWLVLLNKTQIITYIKISAQSCNHFGHHREWKKYLATKILAKVTNWWTTD